LDYAKPLGLNKSRENLNELASHIADFYRPLMEQRQVAFKVICDRDSLECHVDRDRIRQCLINLIQNALEAVPAGHGRIDLTIKKNGDDEAIIEVADNGSGISKDVQANLFNLFFTTKPQGTGIGLSTVQKIVNSHGGRIEVESEPSQGTRIRISLPIQDGEMS
jgi:signal transduction histidine kinase